MEATRTAVHCIDGMWGALARRMMHPGYRLIVRWCDHLEFEDVLRIDHASIVAAASDSKRFLGRSRIVFGGGQLPTTVVPFGLVNVTHRYITERERDSGMPAAPQTPVFAEVFGETVTRASLRDAIHRAIILVRLSATVRVDPAGHLS
jgi:hypothetical protein